MSSNNLENSQSTGYGSSPPAGDARHEHTAGRADAPAPGAPPTNRAPGNCKVLGYGVDSLYLSYRGRLRDEWIPLLEQARTHAQAINEADQAKAQVSILDHRFEVSSGGSKLYRYRLEDGAYQIQLSQRRASNVPVAYVQLRSRWLTSVGVEQAVSQLGTILQAMVAIEGEPNISRVDLFVDFVTGLGLDESYREAFVSRGRYVGTHHVDGAFSGFSIGAGGTMSARLYDKTLEIEKSKKDYLKLLWATAGWIPGEQVFRLEFQYRNEILKELGLRTYSELAEACGGIWRYAAQEWLRLSIPNPDDHTKARWPTHPLWAELADLPWIGMHPGTRTPLRKDRAPSSENLFRDFEAVVTSYMAAYGVTEPESAISRLLTESKQFIDDRFNITGQTFEGRYQSRAARKAKQFNLAYPGEFVITEAKALQDAADAYRKAKGG